MKTLKLTYLFAFTIVLVSCKNEFGSQDTINAAEGDYQYADTAQLVNVAQNRKAKKATDPFDYFDDLDKTNGMVASRIKLPKGWKRSKTEGYAFEGPGQMRIGDVQMSPNFYYTWDSNMQYSYQLNGVHNTYPLELEQIVEEYFTPYAEQSGMRLVSTHQHKEIAEKYQAFLESNFRSAPTQIMVDCVGLEWVDANNKKYYTILRRVISKRQNQLSWSFNNQHIESPSNEFGKAKKIHLDGIMSEEYNLEWLHLKNQQAAAKSNQQYREHQARMASLRLNSTSSSYNKSVGDTYSEILDINHNGYLKNSNIQYGGHQKTVNMIGEQVLIGNHGTGEHYKVASGSKYYWVNQNGKYIGTDNINFDPRADKRINNVQWSKFNVEQ